MVALTQTLLLAAPSVTKASQGFFRVIYLF